jgi:hypothetical protein
MRRSAENQKEKRARLFAKRLAALTLPTLSCPQGKRGNGYYEIINRDNGYKKEKAALRLEFDGFKQAHSIFMQEARQRVQVPHKGERASDRKKVQSPSSSSRGALGSSFSQLASS